MDFTRDESQDAVAEVVVSLLERESARDIALWPVIADSGLLAVPLPERFGGDDMGLLEVSAMLTELATDAVQTPALSTLGFGVLPLLAIGVPDTVAEKVFPAVAEGAVLTAALHETGAPFTVKPETVAVADGATVRVTGHKIAVPYADTARWILVPTDAGIALVDGEAPGITRTASPTSDGVPEFSLQFDQVQIPAEQLLPGGLTELHRYALAALGAVADGLLKGVIALTAEHVRTRQQFGRPLAEFQAVAQQIADVYVVSRTLHAAALSANWALAQENPTAEQRERTDDDLDVLAYTVASELPAALQKCHHLHGGIGVDVTHPLHRYYSQAKDIARWLGGESFRLDRLGARCSST
ncbi:acyl-CoA dehydrogenase family protein [Nocardia huaxiensis]|uniref:Acyl-CoA/acyl-ACP dehydrogenase n=1 Tax=Nocardia huaxiensis TaxID=2755382 RepID=A0A7D6VA43_9NOCA|nr:acyl-CoA dehydrogenase family protein [Nocardia huaxiensis]QLY31461.1 acyl-CoA/acyl-ACP dehydrogenase [Nocardia huaxiensis]UFS95011.1 acyl-CoA/acyl-ACP dehydrogenase [Nocardia huaxiensis]